MLKVTKKMINKKELFRSADGKWIGNNNWLILDYFCNCEFKETNILADYRINEILQKIEKSEIPIVKMSVRFTQGGIDFDIYCAYDRLTGKAKFLGVNSNYVDIIDNFRATINLAEENGLICLWSGDAKVGMVQPISLDPQDNPVITFAAEIVRIYSNNQTVKDSEQPQE